MKKILIWGTGKYCKAKYEAVNARFEIIGFVCREKNSPLWHGRPVILPDEIKNYEWDSILILSAYFFEILEDIKILGIPSSAILLGSNYKPYVGLEKMYMGDGRNRLEMNEQYQVIYRGEDEGKSIISNWTDLDIYLQGRKKRTMDAIRLLPEFPVERCQGTLGGKSIKRVYTEDYIKRNRQYIRGIVGEMEERRYTELYGEKEKIKESYVVEYQASFPESEKYGLDIDLSTGKGIIADKFDCFICTHTLTYILDLQNAIKNLLCMMKSGGVVLLTFAGMLHRASAQEVDKYKPFYGILPHVMERLIKDNSGVKDWEIESYGNIKCAAAVLYGISSEQLTEDELMKKDEDYPLIIGTRIVKE